VNIRGAATVARAEGLSDHDGMSMPLLAAGWQMYPHTRGDKVAFFLPSSPYFGVRPSLDDSEQRRDAALFRVTQSSTRSQYQKIY
jgi:hypothetical protein